MKRPLAVLIVEDSESDALLILRLLKQAGYETMFERVETSEEMRSALEKQAWDIIISDYRLPRFDGPAALELSKEIQPEVPFIVVSGAIGEESAVAMMRAGARDYLLKDKLARLVPAVQRELEQAVIQHQRKRAEEKLRQLSSAVEHSPAAISITGVDGKIEYVNPKFTSLNGYALEEVRGKTPSILKSGRTPAKVYADLWLTILAGEEWHGEMLNRKKSGETYWESIWISPITDSNGVITHFVAVSEDITLRRENEEKIKHLNAGLEQLAMTDYLTSLYNRRYFMQRGAEEFKRSRRSRQPLSLLMMDIDHFKKINDTYGHEAGDMVLQQISATLRSSLRETDILGRIGGEEFAVLLPNTLLKESGLLAERILHSVRNSPCEIPQTLLVVTISIGASVITDSMSGIDDMLRNADLAMYKAKHRGGNCAMWEENIPASDQSLLSLSDE